MESNEQNKLTNTIKPEARTHGTDWQISEGREMGDHWERLAKGHPCVYPEPTDTDNNVAKAAGGAGLGRGQQSGGRGHCNSVNNKKIGLRGGTLMNQNRPNSYVEQKKKKERKNCSLKAHLSLSPGDSGGQCRAGWAKGLTYWFPNVLLMGHDIII